MPRPKTEADPCLGEPHCSGSPRFSRVMERSRQEMREYSDKLRCNDCGKVFMTKRIPDPEPAESEEEEKPAGMSIADTGR